MKIFQKQPRDHLDYDIDLGDWLDQEDRIQGIEVDVPDGIVVTHTGYTDSRAKVWIKGGESGKNYKFSVLVTTNSRQKEVDFMITVVDM